MANTQNLEISISKIAAGMKRCNELKAEMKSILQLLSGYLSDHAQAEINRKPANLQMADGDDWYRIKDTLLLKQQGSLSYKIDYAGRNKVDFIVFYIDPEIGEPTAILKGTRTGDSGRTDYTITPEVLSAHHVADCYQLVELLYKETMRFWYPEELAAEAETFSALAEM